MKNIHYYIFMLISTEEQLAIPLFMSDTSCPTPGSNWKVQFSDSNNKNIVKDKVKMRGRKEGEKFIR